MDAARRPLVAGNWKMNAGGPEGCDLAEGVAKAVKKLGPKKRELVEVVVAPPFTALGAVAHKLAELGSAVGLAAQNMHHEPKGAFTGEISTSMVQDAGAGWVILGHSERRQHCGETDELVAEKVGAAFGAGLIPIVCVGETLEEREAEQTLEVVKRQVQAVLEHLGYKPGVGVIAYEPIWAIGTGKVAKPADAQQVHEHIRALLNEAAAELGASTRILYGGSVKASNAAGLFGQPDIDGALVGGASLKADGFGKIVLAAVELAESAKKE